MLLYLANYSLATPESPYFMNQHEIVARGYGNLSGQPAAMWARAAQTINPSASLNKDPVSGVDGQAAKEAMGRYHDSFKTPPPTFNVINVTGGQ